MNSAAPTVLLLDNGSLEPGATLNLRRLAAELGTALGLHVHPVSLLHSHKVPAEALEGKPAEIFSQAMRRLVDAGATELLILPLFFGPSGAITEYLPKLLAELQTRHPELCFRQASCLVDLQTPEDDDIVSILEDQLRKTLPPDSARTARVLLVDHGSPKREVTAVRDHLAKRLAERLGSQVLGVSPASMERRPEPEYDFTRPLLEDALHELGQKASRIVVAQLFLSPGRHAGPGGDIETICAKAKEKTPSLQILLTPLVGTHPKLIPLLAKRYHQALPR